MKLTVVLLILFFSLPAFCWPELIQNHLRLEAFGVNKKNILEKKNENDSLSESQLLPGLEGAIGWNYEIIPSLLTVTKLRGAAGESDGTARKDEDLVSTAGNKIRLVSENNKYKYEESGLEQMIGYRFEGALLNERVEYRPFITVGYSQGSATYTKSLMTDRAHWALFSKHNRYTYTYDQEYSRQTLGTGLEILCLKSLLISIGYRYSQYRFKNMNTSVSVSGESPEFTQNDIAPPSGYSNQHNSEGYIGVGYHF